MTSIDQNVLLPYSAQQMFDLVNDIESYPEFMEGCLAAEILERRDTEIIARLELGKAGLHYGFTTSNTLVPPESMVMTLLEGPFKHFDAVWTFTPLSETACKASLRMDFEFSLGLVDVALKSLFNSTSRSLVNAVGKRAQFLYGK